ncbi:MAG: hypothetical protein KKG92_10770 [Gammaproteobacteria bacterium]|nr:hypothetical protein [Gammaproteobacteria bacterium]
MNFHLPPPLRRPVIWFAASLLLGSSVFYLALDARMASKTRQLAALTAADTAARDLRRTPERLAQDHAQAATYSQLSDKGFLGEEDRIDWLGSLARLRDSLALQQISWHLTPRVASDLSAGLYSSSMALEITPIDAHRLQRFLEQLRALTHGHFTVRECTLQPDNSGKQGTASCTLDWWTWNGE